MKKLITHLSLSIIMLFCSVTSAAAQQRGLAVTPTQINDTSWGTYYALIIGINDYAKWPRLQTAVKDATVIRDTLVSRYGFAKESVILRTNKAASRLQITRDLRYLAQSMRPDDNLLIYYAGHGQLDDLTGDGYWVPAEGAMKDPATWVANSYIKAILSSEKVQAKNVVVIADSCYSGSMLRGGPSLMSMDDQRYREKLAEKAALRSRQVISSGGVEPVTDGGADGHSLFAYYLINALRKNDREVIDLENLFHTQVWKPVTEIGDQRPNVGRLKTPMDQDGQFVLYNATWAREQQARREAVKAERQKQAEREAQAERARQKAAVASAELELQRQRIEMEKQRLALEREQLARERALEQQQAELEKQKQEIEYAKLQARLEALEQQKNANEKLLSRGGGEKDQSLAAVSPATTSPPRVSKGSYNLAIFPLKYYTADYASEHVDGFEKETLKGIADLAAYDERLTLKFSYESIEGNVAGVTLLNDILENHKLKIWEKKSIFSKMEPNWETIRKIGREIGANPIVTGIADVGVGDLTFYVYDTEKDRLYTKKIAEAYWQVVPQVAKKMVKELTREFFTNR